MHSADNDNEANANKGRQKVIPISLLITKAVVTKIVDKLEYP